MLTLVDPVFVNPNSYDSIVTVLRHIGKVAGVKWYGGEEREWVSVCCDGLPYSIVLRVTQEYITCAECKEGFMGVDNFESHAFSKHDGNVKHIREFDWVMLTTGDGHYEMNLMKTFFELNWDVCLKALAQKMGWNSELALKCAKNCYDNHKTWQILMIYHFGMLCELILPYVNECQVNATEPTAEGYLQYAKTGEFDVNYMYLFEMTTRYSQGIFNLRAGIRGNNSLLVQSAKMMTRGRFHGRNHPKYQLIEMTE